MRWETVQVVGDSSALRFWRWIAGISTCTPVHGDQNRAQRISHRPRHRKLGFINRMTTGEKNPFTWQPIDQSVHRRGQPRHLDHCRPRSEPVVRWAHPVTSSHFREGRTASHGQPYAKPHQVVFDPTGRFVAVPDKGLDRVFVFQFDAGAGKLVAVEAATMATREAAGPRHIAFHPDSRCAYVVNELDSTVNACRFDAVSGHLRRSRSFRHCLTQVADNRAAEIEASADGRHVCVSTAATIVSVSSHASTGRLGRLDGGSAVADTPVFALSRWVLAICRQ
jgi:hypothetical protein